MPCFRCFVQPSLCCPTARAPLAEAPQPEAAGLGQRIRTTQDSCASLCLLQASLLNLNSSPPPPFPHRLAVLLHGAPGSGRQAAVRAAAEAAGCQVVALSCHDLKPAHAPEKTMLGALRAAFEAAGRYRPAVLLLRHFEVLGAGTGGEFGPCGSATMPLLRGDP